MSWWMIAPALQVGSSILSSINANDQNSNQLAWNQYNAQSSYNVTMHNINAQAELMEFNAQLQMAAGAANAELAVADAKFNADMIWQTSLFNDSLMESKISDIWESEDLDLLLLGQERARERGMIQADQAASGVVMDQDSSEQVVISQRAQEALDAFVIAHNADVAVTDIQNARAQGLWEGQAQIQKTLWEGQMGATSSLVNSGLQAAGIMAESAMMKSSGIINAQQQLESNLNTAAHTYGANSKNISNRFVDGLFSAGSSLVGGYYMDKMSTLGSTASTSSVANSGSYAINYSTPNYTTPGTTLVG